MRTLERSRYDSMPRLKEVTLGQETRSRHSMMANNAGLNNSMEILKPLKAERSLM